MSPLFSVIIPTYNRRDFLITCIGSVLVQTFKDYEIVVVDDGSTDKTPEILPDYTGKGITYIKKSHGGVSNARNTGIQNSRGRFLAFLDSDDRWDSRKLELTAEYISRFPDINIFHTDETWYRRGKILNQKKKHKRPSGRIYENCLPLCCIGMSTSVVRRELFDELGDFDEELPACEDYDFWLRACINHEVKLIPEPLTLKDGGREDQLSNQPGLDKYRIYSLEKILNSGLLNEVQYQLTFKTLEDKCRVYATGAKKRGRIVEADFYLDKIKKYEKNIALGGN